MHQSETASPNLDDVEELTTNLQQNPSREAELTVSHVHWEGDSPTKYERRLTHKRARLEARTALRRLY